MDSVPIQIDVAYAEPQRAVVKTLYLPSGCCVADAIRMVAQDPDFQGVALENPVFGIFGRVVNADQVLKDGDRVEIYRPLAADPKIARRLRAKQHRR